MFLDTGIEQVAGRARRGRCWACDGASLESVLEPQDDIMSGIGSIATEGESTENAVYTYLARARLPA